MPLHPGVPQHEIMQALLEKLTTIAQDHEVQVVIHYPQRHSRWFNILQWFANATTTICIRHSKPSCSISSTPTVMACFRFAKSRALFCCCQPSLTMCPIDGMCRCQSILMRLYNTPLASAYTTCPAQSERCALSCLKER